MTSTLAGAFRASFKAIVIALALAVLAGAAGYVMAGGNALLAVVFAALGLAVLVALFGFVALQMEMADHLQRIAAAVEGQGAPAAPRPATTDAAVSGVRPQPLRGAEEPALRAPVAPPRPQGPQGRVEPQLTLRRGAG